MMEKFTKELIRAKVGSDPRWASRAIVALFEYQTSTEQEFKTTHEKNSVGFNGVDAEILSSFAEQIKRGRTLSQKQLAIAFKKLPKYAGQLERIANQNVSPVIDKEVNEFEVGKMVTGNDGGYVGEASEIEHQFCGQLPHTLYIHGKQYDFETNIMVEGEIAGFLFAHGGNRLDAFMIIND